jgi:hypothetical protein
MPQGLRPFVFASWGALSKGDSLGEKDLEEKWLLRLVLECLWVSLSWQGSPYRLRGVLTVSLSRD